jgi:hypothetical protein
MPVPRSRSAVNWELLRTEARLAVTRQPGWLAAGLAGPLAITLYTLLRPWTPVRAERDLMQAALFLAAWNTLFALLCICAAWLRLRQDTAEREQLHLPLSTVHFALRRLVHACAVPVTAALLSLPLWGVLLLFYGKPYGTEGAEQAWSWGLSQEVANPWWPRMAWIAVCLLTATLMPSALALLLDLLAPSRYLRGALLVGIPVGMYFAVRLAVGWDYNAGGWGGDYGPLVMNYRQTRGVSPWPYAVLLALCLVLPVAIGWLRPTWRWLLLSLPVLLLVAFTLRRALPESLRAPLRPVSSALFGRDTRYAAALFVGHLSPPKNVRFILYAYTSNVLFGGRAAPQKPEYPEHEMDILMPNDPFWGNPNPPQADQIRFNKIRDDEQKRWDARYAQYEKDLATYEAAYARLPRVAMWVTAGLYPLLLPLWAIAGLLLGIRLRGEPARESLNRSVN